jgi:predicted nucleic acid-binding protein
MKYFLDTSLIIDILRDRRHIEKLLALGEDSKFFINRLVYLESLRTIDLEKAKVFRDSKALLENFTILDMNQEIYEQAVQFSRYCRSKGLSLKYNKNKENCTAIDLLHFITAQYYQLQLLSSDRDLEKLQTTYIDWNHEQQQPNSHKSR